MKPQKAFLISLILVLLSFQLPNPGWSEDLWDKFHPYVTLSETYDDNLYLERDNKTGDFITTIYPGIRFSHSSEGFGIDLDYMLGLNFYASESNRNYVSHSGTLNTFYRLDRRWTVRLKESLIRSEDPLERDYGYRATGERYNISVNRDRSVYLRNVVEPSVEYQFGRENRISLLYRNMIYRPESALSEDSTENSVNPMLTYWFNIRNGLILNYTFTSGTFEQSPDLTGHAISGRYIYRFNPHTSVFGEFSFTAREYESPGTDYTVYNPTVGVEHAFSSTLSGILQAGYFWQKAEGIPTLSGPSLNINITQRARLTTYSLGLEGGYREELYTSENLGATKYYRAFGSVMHQLQRRLSVGFNGTVGRTEFPQALTERIDWTYTGSGILSYQPLKWLTISLEGTHLRNLSNENAFDYIDNRAILRLTATY